MAGGRRVASIDVAGGFNTFYAASTPLKRTHLRPPSQLTTRRRSRSSWNGRLKNTNAYYGDFHFSKKKGSRGCAPYLFTVYLFYYLLI